MTRERAKVSSVCSGVREHYGALLRMLMRIWARCIALAVVGLLGLGLMHNLDVAVSPAVIGVYKLLLAVCFLLPGLMLRFWIIWFLEGVEAKGATETEGGETGA